MSMSDIHSSVSDGIMTSTYTSVNGLLSGIPTRTTQTLTPTTLKNIEESFMEIQQPLEHQHQAGFVPPVVNVNSFKQEDSPWLASCIQNSCSPPLSTSSNHSKPRSSGGRRPKECDKFFQLPPEEEEKRRQRRERNKLAAARCRKRRIDHTNALLEETDGLEDKRRALQSEIEALKTQKEELEFVLEAHKNNCKASHLENGCSMNMRNDKHNEQPFHGKKPRPNCLEVSSAYSNGDMKQHVNASFVATGVSINTPSNGIFNFDSLLEGGTGLTPVSTSSQIITSCSGQQRNSNGDIGSPDGMNPPKLVSL